MRIIKGTRTAGRAAAPRRCARIVHFRPCARGAADLDGRRSGRRHVGRGATCRSPRARRRDASSPGGKACASSQLLLDTLRLEVRRDGDTVYIEAGPRNEGNVVTIGKAYAQLDVGIALPQALPVEARDSSGDFRASGVGRLTLDDSSGDIDLRRIGSAEIKDSSGDIKVTDAGGDVTITFDGSGNIDLSNIGGNAEVGSDGSGDIRIVGVKGNVLIGADGSGDIVVEDVGGDFTLGNDGSGDVLTKNIAGKISVPPGR